MVATEVISKAFRNTCSYTELENCSRKSCKHSREECFPFLSVDTDILKNDFKNLEDVILHNFPEVCDKAFLEKAGIKSISKAKCKLCKGSLSQKRTFGEHLFVEVCHENLLPKKYSNLKIEDTHPMLVRFIVNRIVSAVSSIKTIYLY